MIFINKFFTKCTITNIGITIFFIVFVCIGCSRYSFLNINCPHCDRQLKGHLKKIRKINSNVDLKDWRIRFCYEDSIKSIHYEIVKRVVDTACTFKFVYSPHISHNNRNNCKYKLDELRKSYYKDDYYYSMALLNNDTLYYLKQDRSGYIESDSIFIMGKYYFLDKTGGLSKKQSEYFRAHKDSLIKVRGNDLPKLPE